MIKKEEVDNLLKELGEGIIQEMFDYIKSAIPKDTFNEMLDEAKLEYIDYEQMEEEGIEEEYDYYEQFRTNEAELDVIEHNIMKTTYEHFDVELGIDEHCLLYDMIEEYYKN